MVTKITISDKIIVSKKSLEDKKNKIGKKLVELTKDASNCILLKWEQPFEVYIVVKHTPKIRNTKEENKNGKKED